MGKKLGNQPLRVKHSRQMRSSGKCPTEMNTLSTSDPPPNSQPVPNVVSHLRHLTLPQHNQNLLKFLNEDRTRQRFCDICVSVGGKVYRAHKVVLAHGSSYFHAELSKNPGTGHVTLDHVEDSVFQHLLGFLYTSECVVAETELPALAKAARFLDMMDVFKVLCEAGGIHPLPGIQTQTENSGSKTVDITSNDSPVVATVIQTQHGVQPFLPDSSNELLQAKLMEAEKVSGQKSGSMRRSARRTRTPTKYKGDDVSQPEEKQRTVSSKKHTVEAVGISVEIPVEAVTIVLSKEHKSVQGEDIEDVDEEEEGMNEELEAPKKHSDGCEADKAAGLQSSGAETKEDQIVQEGDLHVAAAGGSSNHKPSYPKDLAPVIIETSSKKNLKCPKCDKVFDRIGKYESHTRVHTGEKPFQCDICLQCYSTKSNLTVHKKKHVGDAPFQKKEHKCSFCNKLHASKKTLAKHVRRFHPDHIQEFLSKRKKKSEVCKCAICLKTFTRRPHLQEHMILHTQDRPFKCSFCDECFKSRFARLKHQEKYHLGPFPCEICGRQFNDTGNRKRHIECTHGGKRKWTCFVCGKSVRERTTLKEHLRIHSGEKPHLCSICGQSFRHGSSYRLHLRVHHDDKRYECVECGKTFIRHDHLTKHQKIHSGEKAHQCEECGKCFRRHDHLTVHYKSVHLGEKVWQKYKTAVHQCEVCKKEFKGKSSLDMHFRTHSGEKPYNCPECHQTFRIKKTLTKHMVIHSDARPFNCPHCNATFKRKDKLKYHVDHVHSNRFPAQPVGRLSEDKTVSLTFEETPKVYCAAPKSAQQNNPTSTNICVPVTIVPVQITGVSIVQGDLSNHGTSTLTSPSHSVNMQAQGQQQNSGYQPTTELTFLERFTLNPQSTNVVNPVRPDHMLDPREQSYLGTFLGLDSASAVQNISNSDHPQ
ncbi:zinc finger and BTB domain-containing protein 41 [Thalassophryne amazonica]|uniref:zinc finger and BTB domain-containing protein 41 n=1 Tax=Thalassophryne amazonica TaxID=390379 RepID=UPI001471A417|nr:zinc finger and BTB domain-containing protein 41 [Thalassophryne amazonica]XP_034038825.1 zinc finger and BTB domain-containing protein 41 [Thalassophryne amazonica]XP_034038826.1 zinc finger and BTB domain-containing protein 41 [Thalassophryne amazonica]